MSIIYTIPKTSKLIQSVNTFTAIFNNPAPGQYSFSSAGNTNQKIISTQKNSLYFFERVNVGGNISAEKYFDAIITLPILTLKYKIENVNILSAPLPVVNYIDNQETNLFLFSDKDGDEIQGTFTGLLDQTVDLIGVVSVKVFVAFNIYQITDNQYIQDFRDTTEKTRIGASTRRETVGNSFFTA